MLWCRVMLSEEKRLLVTDLKHRLDEVLANMEIKFFTEKNTVSENMVDKYLQKEMEKSNHCKGQPMNSLEGIILYERECDIE